MLAYSKINYMVYEVSLKAQRIPGHIKLHKGFHYRDSSYNDFGKKKKRSLSTNQSDFFGLPYRIYSATPGYQYNVNKCNDLVKMLLFHFK